MLHVHPLNTSMRALIDLIERHHKPHKACGFSADGIAVSLHDFPDVEEGRDEPLVEFEGVDETKQQTLQRAINDVKTKLQPYGLDWLLNCRIEVKQLSGNTAGQYRYPDDIITVDPRFDDDFHVVAHEVGHRFLAKRPTCREALVRKFKSAGSADFTSAYAKTSPDEFWAEAFAACVARQAPGALATWVKSVVKGAITEASVRLSDIYDSSELRDSSERIGLAVDERGSSFVDEPFQVGKMKPSALTKLRCNGEPILQAFKGAEAWQKRLVKQKTNAFDANRIVVLDGREIIDGNHHVVAAIQADQPILYIDIGE